MATVMIEGQKYDLDDAVVNAGASVAESDQILRDALRPQFPIAAGATFQRDQRNGHPYITLVKHAATKGALKALKQVVMAPEAINPVMAFACELHLLEARASLDVEAAMHFQEPLDQVIERGRAEEQAIKQTLRVLRRAPAVVDAAVPVGL